MLASQLSTLASCSLVLSLHRDLNRERVKKVGLLAVKLLVMGASSQLGSLSTGMILRLEIGETVWPGWIVLEEDLGDERPL